MKGALNRELREELEKAAKKSKTFYEITESEKVGLQPYGDRLFFSLGGVLIFGIEKTDNNKYVIFEQQTNYEKVDDITIETIKV